MAIDARHTGYVQDLKYDFYGQRLATAGSDQRVKIWSKSDGGEWVPQVSWKAHLGPVWRVSWAHPEFGQLLASCSLDRNVNIWEEQENVDAAGHVVSRWHKRAQLGDALDSVNDVRFAPRHLGLKLAAGSADGRVRVYEAFDVMNLAHWEFTEQFESGVGSVAALAWSTSPFDAPLMAVCGAAAIAQVWGFNGSSRMWLPMAELAGHSDRLHDIAWAPTIGRSYHLIATASRDGVVGLWRLQPESATDAAGSGVGAAVLASTAPPPPAAFRTRRLPGASCDVECIAAFAETPGLPVWRVDWNVTGTVLAASSDDGTVRLRRRTLAGAWECVSVIDAARAPGGPGDGSALPADEGDDAASQGRAPGQASAAVAATTVPVASGGVPVPSGRSTAFGASFFVGGGGGGPLARP